MCRPGLTLHQSADLEALAAVFAATLGAVADPFDRPLVLVPGAGVQRWWGQQLAQIVDPDGEGVAAGLDMHRAGELERLLEGRARHDDDPWSTERLVWHVLRLGEAGDDDALAPLARHLAATEQRYANALRVARLLGRYADHRPAMLAAWSADPRGEAGRLGVDGWQVRLWQRLCAEVGAPDPVTRRARLAEAVATGEHRLPWPVVHLVAPHGIPEADVGLIRACARQVPVSVWYPSCGPTEGARHGLALALGRRPTAEQQRWRVLADLVVDVPATEPPATVLGALQGGVHTGRSQRLPGHGDDGTVQVHASHGPARQVEVLREVLTGLFADDPSLEPRDVVVACPDPAALAPHLEAVFGPGTVERDAVTPGWSHPGTGLRVQVAQADAATANRLYQLLADLLALPATRATAGQLLGLAAHPFVARRFGFGPDELERLEELVDAATIRWGINGEHRRSFGIGHVLQNTWQLGVQRLVMGEAFSGDDLAAAGVVATVDDVTSTDAPVIGGLAELVSRVSRAVRSCSASTTAAGWADRLTGLVTDMVDVPFEESWQLTQVWAALESLRVRGADSATPLTRHDAQALLDAAFADTRTRPSFGNGSLVVCELGALGRVPHRVVCLVGLDERSFPRRELGDGDDLLTRRPEALDPDPGLTDRHLLLDAVLAARERLVVVYQGHSSLTHEPYPPPAGVVDLLEAVADATGRARADDVPHHWSLQPFSPRNFDPAAPRSFDLEALAGARALTAPRRAEPDRYAAGHLHDPRPPATWELGSLQELLRHPARYLLRQRASLTPAGGGPVADDIPLELDGLAQWTIGNLLLDGLRAGHSPDALRTSTWLSGLVPPHQLGARVLDAILAKAVGIHEQFLAAADHQVGSHVVDVTVEGARVTGRLVSRAGRVATTQFSRPDARHAASAWLEVLALTLHLERRVDALVIGPNGHRLTLSGPPLGLAEQFLGELVLVARHARQRVLLMPPRVSQRWALARARGSDPLAEPHALRDQWRKDRDAVWDHYVAPHSSPWEKPRTEDDPWGHPTEPCELGALAATVWAPIVKASA